MMRRHLVLWLVAAALAAAGGCQSTLEDGYKPRALNASTAQRRAYYASPFTPEAAAAEQEHPNDTGKFRQPGSY
jgi:hypothetical protein